MSNGHGVAVSVETSSFWAKNSSDTRVRHGACRGRVAVSCNTVYTHGSASNLIGLIYSLRDELHYNDKYSQHNA